MTASRLPLRAAVFAVVLAVPLVADVRTFHGGPGRAGWINDSAAPSRSDLASGRFGEVWQSPELDWADGRPPRLYATPLYLADVDVRLSAEVTARHAVVIAATSNGFVYAINARATATTPAGAILWRTGLPRLAKPGFDGVNLGIMSTPVIDPTGRILYVCTCASAEAWQVFALDTRDGKVLPGWPVTIDAATLGAPGINRNAAPEPPAGPVPKRALFGVQRGALNLSPDASRLYVTFGESLTGWLVSVATGEQPRVASAFASVRLPHRTSGGVWGAGGPAIDEEGNIFVVTGANFGSLKEQPHDWTQSALQLTDRGPDGLVLRSSYAPFNYGDTANADIDLGSGGACLLPPIFPQETSTPLLMAFGGKQGNVYLLNRRQLPGGTVERQPPSRDSSTDLSLLSPDPQPQFAQRGPLNVFGPYSETKGAMDKARSRSVPAYFRRGADYYLFVTGQTKVAEDADEPTAPCLARLRVVTTPGQPAYLKVDQLEPAQVFGNPGSPLVSSRGPDDAVVWVLDENALRTALLSGDQAPRPVLYAFDALTLKLLWKSPAGALHTSGKYNEPLIATGLAIVGTDRIQAFGPQASPTPVNPSAEIPTPTTPVPAAPLTGKDLYYSGGACAVCHGVNGEGLPGINPPLAGSEWVTGPEDRLIRILLHGLQGPVNVAGKEYVAAAMPGFGRLPTSPFNWEDEKVAAVLTYIRSAWGNDATAITADTVRRIRESIGDRSAWTQSELLNQPGPGQK